MEERHEVEEETEALADGLESEQSDVEGQAKESETAPACLHIRPARPANLPPAEDLQCHCDQPFRNQP